MPRYRKYAGPALLSAGFRPFFLLGALWSLLALVLSVALLQGSLELPTALDPIAWHFHEMLFGYVAAAVAGFLLTAIPNWTGRLPLQGGPLAVLVALWLVGRLALGTSALIGAGLAAALDLAFLLALTGATLREVVAGRNWRNLPIVLAIGLLCLANILFHVAELGWFEAGDIARRLGISVVVGLITLIGGRVTPSFTRNWLVKRGATALPASFGKLDRFALAVTLAALLCWTVWPEGPVTAVALAAASLLTLARLLRWRGLATLAEPLLSVLHLAYLWLPAGMALAALNAFFPGSLGLAAVHALTAGAMGTMTLAVMSRATLGHTGRPLEAGVGLSLAFGLITLAALGRVAAALLPELYGPLLYGSAAAWLGAFALFLIACGPALFGPSPRTT